MTYEEQLKSPKWQKVRLKVFERDDFKCTKCNSETKTLHCHHIKYEKSRMAWDIIKKKLMKC